MKKDGFVIENKKTKRGLLLIRRSANLHTIGPALIPIAFTNLFSLNILTNKPTTKQDSKIPGMDPSEATVLKTKFGSALAISINPTREPITPAVITANKPFNILFPACFVFIFA